MRACTWLAAASGIGKAGAGGKHLDADLPRTVLVDGRPFLHFQHFRTAELGDTDVLPRDSASIVTRSAALEPCLVVFDERPSGLPLLRRHIAPGFQRIGPFGVDARKLPSIRRSPLHRRRHLEDHPTYPYIRH